MNIYDSHMNSHIRFICLNASNAMQKPVLGIRDCGLHISQYI